MTDYPKEPDLSNPPEFEELPDAPPKRRIRFSWTGKIAIGVVVFWAVMVVIGPGIAPYHEADFLDEALFIVPGSDNPYPPTDFQPPSKVAYLGTDYLGRDTLSPDSLRFPHDNRDFADFHTAGLYRGNYAWYPGGCWRTSP